MNDVIAKRVNDTYLIRCAQILNNKTDVISRTLKQNDGSEHVVFFISSDGIKTDSGKLIPYKDGFKTIAIRRNNKSITMALVGTDFMIKVYADKEKCYYKNSALHIEIKYDNIFINKDSLIEKNLFQFVGSNSTICTQYALSMHSVVEIIYFNEKRTDIYGTEAENSIVNSWLANKDNKEIIAFVKELDELVSKRSEQDEEVEDEVVEPLQESDLEGLPDEIKALIDNSDQAANNSRDDLSCDEKQLNRAVIASTCNMENMGEMIALDSNVRNIYVQFYEEAKRDGDDCFFDNDMYGEEYDLRDFGLEEDLENQLDNDFDEFEDEFEENEDEDYEIDCGSERFELYRSVNNEYPIIFDCSEQDKSKIIGTISEYVLCRDVEYSDLHGLLLPMIRVFKQIEENSKEFIEQVAEKNNDKFQEL